MLNISCIWCLPLGHSSPCSYVSDRKPQSYLPDTITGYCHQPMTLSERRKEEKNQDPNTFAHHQLLTVSPHLI